MKVIFLCLFLIDISLGNNNYPHLVEKAVFPPVLSKAENSDEAVGHKKPLGSQNAPQGPIIEYDKFLEPKTLWEKHVDPHIPLVYRGAIKDSPAVKEWVKDEYLTKKYGDLDVLVEHKKEDRSSTSGRMTLKDFLKHYKTDDLYVVSMFPSEMMGEVKAINSIMCGTFRNFTHESNLWISAGGTRSVVHYDADHNFHCVIDGRKDFIMIPNNLATKTNLYFKQKDPGVGSGFSFLDPDSIDMKKFPKIAKVPWTWATLYPGDCIFIPSIYIHQVRGYGRTLAVTTLFTADIQDNFNADDCPSDITQKDYTMADINFLWTYKKGDPTIDMGYMNTELVKNQLLDALDDDVIKDGKMTMKQFILFTGTFSPYGRNRTKMAAVWKDIFKIEENGYLDAKKVKSLDLHQMKIFCRAVESPHGVVTNGSEPVFVRPGERHKWEIATDYEEDASDRYEEDEDEIRRLTHYDNMLQHLSDEERQAYIEKRREEKQKFGVQYDGDHMDLSQLSEPARILMQLSWRIDDIPEEHHPHILRGRIPEDFRDEFLSALPESLLEKYEKYFEKDRIPKVMVKALIAAKRDDYTKRMREELESEEGESEEERNEESKKDEL